MLNKHLFRSSVLALATLSSACGSSVSATRDDGGAMRSDATTLADVTPPTPVQCDVGQWCWQTPLPQGNALKAALTVSARDAWAVGDRGTIVHFDGERWSQIRSPTDVDLDTLWGSGPNDLWAYGLRTAVSGDARYAMIHWDGARWQTVSHGPLPFIRDLHGSGADNVWLVTAGNNSAAALQRWNGAAFTAAPPLPDSARAHSVCARSTTEVWVTAADERNSWPSLLYRWDGSAWTLAHRTELARGERLHSGVVCPADGVALVGLFDFESGVETYLEVRDGRVGGDALPLPARSSPTLRRTPHGSVYYVSSTEAVEWTPNGWQRRFTLAGSSVFSMRFDHLPDRSAGTLVDGTPFVSTLRDSRWIADPLAVRDTLRSFVGSDPSRNSDPIAVFGTTVWAHPDNARWTHRETPMIANGAQLSVHAMWGASIDRWWLVGEGGAVARYDARTQSITAATVSEPVTESLLAIDGDATAAWAVGNNGAVLRLEGERWARAPVELPREVEGHRLTSLTLTSVDVISDNDVMILGNDPLGGRFGSIFFRWDGARWSASITFGATLSRFDRDPRGNVYLVRDNQLEKRPAAGGAPIVMARLTDSVLRLRAFGEDDIELVLSNQEGIYLANWDADRRSFIAKTPVLTAVGASNIVAGASDPQGRAVYWAAGASGAVLRYASPN